MLLALMNGPERSLEDVERALDMMGQNDMGSALSWYDF